MQQVLELAQLAMAETAAFTNTKGRDAVHKVMYLDQGLYDQVRAYQRKLQGDCTNRSHTVNARFCGYQLFSVNNSPSHVRIITE